MDKMREALEKARENILRVQAWEDHTDPDPQSNWHCYQRAIEAVDAALSSERQESGEHVLVPKAAIAWLLGEGPDDNGLWFGDFHPDQPKGHFWWRTVFRRMMAATPSQESGRREGWPSDARFQMGDTVRKTSGSLWHGTVVGWYRTELTPLGYAVESHTEKGSVQIYPEKALEPWTSPSLNSGGQNG